MLRPLEIYEQLLNESVKKYLLQLEMENAHMAEAIYTYEVLPYLTQYKQSLWAKHFNDGDSLTYITNDSGKIIKILISMDRAIKF